MEKIKLFEINDDSFTEFVNDKIWYNDVLYFIDKDGKNILHNNNKIFLNLNNAKKDEKAILGIKLSKLNDVFFVANGNKIYSSNNKNVGEK